MKMIKLAEPYIGFRESFNVLKAMKSKEISGYSSQFVPSFEQNFAKFVGVKYALSVNSGTSALMLSVRALNLKPGDKVAVSALTNMATYFPLLQMGIVPVPVDIDPVTLNMNPDDLLRIMNQGIQAIIVVHLYGLPADMHKILKIAKDYEVDVIEDCAESLGATQHSTQTGAFGKMGCFSFYANKIITTGEGGMVTTNDPSIYEYMRNLRSLGFGRENKFLHDSDGYNFRLSNVQAAIGLAQLSKVQKIIKMKKEIAHQYNLLFKHNKNLQLPIEPTGFSSVYWMYTVVINEYSGHNAQSLRNELSNRNIEAREGFICFSDQFKLLKQFNLTARETPVASKTQSQILYLPSGPNLSRARIRRVAAEVNSILSHHPVK